MLAPGPYFATAALALPLARAAGLDIADDAERRSRRPRPSRSPARAASGGPTTRRPRRSCSKPTASTTCSRSTVVARLASLDAGRPDRCVASARSTRRGGCSRSTSSPPPAPTACRVDIEPLAATRHGRARRRDARHRAMAAGTRPSSTRSNGCSSTCPSAASRPSSTSSPTARSTSSGPASAVYYAAMCIDADDPRTPPRRARRQGRRRPGRHPLRQGRRCRSTAASATRGSTTCTCSSAGPTRSEHLLGTAGWHHDRLADLILG